jgi:calcineurin-like phosphoesterase family protein
VAGFVLDKGKGGEIDSEARTHGSYGSTGLEKLNKTGAVLAVLVLMVAINGFLYYRYQANLANPPSHTPEPVLVGAGDIADCTQTTTDERTTTVEATARLLDNIEGTVFTAGDNAYPSGTDEDFENCYDPTWGRHKARTYPATGNHEYETANASGYFNYFGAAAGDPGEGYYSYDLGEWHVVALNSNIAVDPSSAQYDWLRADLASNTATCTVAYWHHPLFSSGEVHGNQDQMKPTWEVLYAANVDVVVTSHDHIYERFAPQDPNGVADSARGIREFVVGTGGASLHPIEEAKPNSEVQNDDTHGVLKLTLHSTSYDWEFVPIAGKTFTDSGSDSCH